MSYVAPRICKLARVASSVMASSWWWHVCTVATSVRKQPTIGAEMVRNCLLRGATRAVHPHDAPLSGLPCAVEHETGSGRDPLRFGTFTQQHMKNTQ